MHESEVVRSTVCDVWNSYGVRSFELAVHFFLDDWVAYEFGDHRTEVVHGVFVIGRREPLFHQLVGEFCWDA